MPEDVLLGRNTYIIDNENLSGFPLNLASGSGTADIGYDMISTSPTSASSSSILTYPLNFLLHLYFCKDDSVKWNEISDGDLDETYTYGVNTYTATTSDVSYSLVDDANGPTLTVSALKGNYRSGDVIPITITGNEYIKVPDMNAKIEINNEEYSLRDLHASSSGKYITLFYEVKEIDAGTLTVDIPANTFTDFWGNGNTEVNNETVDGVNITTPVLKNAVTGLSASYNVSTGEVEFSIAVSQVEQYRNSLQPLHKYQPAFQLLVAVDDRDAQTVAAQNG